MPRPPRIEYEGAFHHVINRGRHRRTIFHDKEEFEIFLTTLSEASQRFSAVIHAYCLMTNHYHLIIETPKANLSNIMKYVNGIYSQRYNRKRKIDGPLFRGRYKSVLIDADSYLLQLSRYVHRNPVEVKRKMVNRLQDYPWSSYPAYINKAKSPDWLYRDKTYQMLGHRNRFAGFADYVEAGIDEDIKRFYSKGNILSVLGDKEFRTERKEEHDKLDLEGLRRALEDKVSMDELLNLLVDITKQALPELLKPIKGKRIGYPYRAFAIYACHEYSSANHLEIANKFGLSNVGSTSHPITTVCKEITKGNWKKELKQIEKLLFVVK